VAGRSRCSGYGGSTRGFMLAAGSVHSAKIRLDSTVQAELLGDHISRLSIAKSASMDLAFYEFPDYYDHLTARSEAIPA